MVIASFVIVTVFHLSTLGAPLTMIIYDFNEDTFEILSYSQDFHFFLNF